MKISASTLVQKLLFVTVLAVASAFAGLGMQQAHAAENIEDCTKNSIIKCGVTSASDFIATVKADKQGDLKALYGSLNFTSKYYDDFVKEAKIGTAKTNGDIVVDGQVISRNSWSLGRDKKSYSEPYKVGNVTYQKSMSTDVLAKDLPVLVWFDSNGNPAAVIIMACGNPMGGKGVVPGYKCDELQAKADKDEANTYDFTTNAPTTGSAKVSKVVYHFGDGSKAETRPSVDDVVTHTYKKSGTFSAKATVYVKLPNGKEITVNGDGCVKKIVVKIKKPAPTEKAAWQCTGLKATAKTKTNDDYAYTLRANTKLTNASLVSGDFDFGDGSTQNDVKPAETDDTFISVDHAYKTAGDHTAKVTLTFKADKGAKAATDTKTDITCAVTFTIKQLTTPATVTPAVSTTPTTPAVLSAATTAVKELPATGPAGLVGLFAGTSALGAVGYRWNARRRLSKVDDLIDRLQR